LQEQFQKAKEDALVEAATVRIETDLLAKPATELNPELPFEEQKQKQRRSLRRSSKSNLEEEVRKPRMNPRNMICFQPI